MGTAAQYVVRFRFHLHLPDLQQVTALRASTDNLATTVLELFLSAMARYGAPYRVHGDRGGENVLVSAYMIMKHGPNHGSFLWGR